MKKLAQKYISVFAHFDKDNLVDDYVLEYLAELKKISPKIIFVSDCNLRESETKKLSNLCETIIAKRHGEYDFGSYKRGIEFLKNELENYDKLIIANDSCYLANPLSPVFEKMANKNCDFWGMTINHEGYASHIQSYFMVFGKEVFLSDIFKQFFSSVKKEESKNDVIKKYETSLTQILLKAGFKVGSMVEKNYETSSVMSQSLICGLLESGFPLLKVWAVKLNPNPPELKKIFFELLPKKVFFVEIKSILNFPEINWRKFFDKYQLQIIDKHIARIGLEEEFRFKIFNEKFLFFLIKKQIFRVKIFGITVFKNNIPKPIEKVDFS
jgi:lipopolysaccharide biosynthesis protein